VYSTNTGKAKIVNLTLPTLATGIVEGVIPDNYTYNPTFMHFAALKTVSGAGVTSIGMSAFYASNSGPAALTSVSFPVAASIGVRAFQDCTALTSVSFPMAASIGIEAFVYCTGLTSVSFPVAASIGGSAFGACTGLTSVTMSKALTLENFNNAGFGMSDNKIVWTLAGGTGDWTTAEDGKMLIYQGTTLAYYHAASGNLTLPDTITAIGERAFQGCTALTSVSLPVAAAIGMAAFIGCTGLTSVSLPAATAIGEYAFGGCTGLTSVNLPAATAIGMAAFNGCTGLTSVSAPQAAAIGIYAFQSCTSLASVTLGGTPPTLGGGIFYNIDTAQTVTVHIPDTAKTTYGVPNLPGTNFDNTSTANSWGRAFKGIGWDGTNYIDGWATVNDYITLRFETYTEE
jgi:hypothetical protein